MDNGAQMREDFAAAVRAIEGYSKPLKRIIYGLATALIVSNLIWAAIVFGTF